MEYEKKGELWTNMGTGRMCEAGAPLFDVEAPPSFFASSNFCSNSRYGVVMWLRLGRFLGFKFF